MLIGLNGFKGAGKDTVGDYLVEKYDFTKVSFAALLKQSAAALFDVDPSVWEILKNDPGAHVTIHAEHYIAGFTVREFLQRYGTESHRDVFGQDFWVDNALNGLDLESGKNYAFTDARFPNELEAIHKLEGFNIRVERPSDSTDTHVSEQIPDAWLLDATVDNSGTKEELYKQIDDVVTFWFDYYEGARGR